MFRFRILAVLLCCCTANPCLGANGVDTCPIGPQPFEDGVSLMQYETSKDRFLQRAGAPQLAEEESDCGKGADMDFSEFMQMHGRTYAHGSKEYHARHANFKRHAERVKAHNCQPGPRSWVAGMNHLADRSESELAAMRGYKRNARPSGSSPLGGNPGGHLRSSLLAAPGKVIHDTPMPATKSWSHLKSLTLSRDQGDCGSCWAFGATTTMRAHAELSGRGLQNYSISQIVACTPNPKQCGGSGGCDGATVELAYEYVMKYGLKTDQEMPYDKRGHCPAELKGTDPDTTSAEQGRTDGAEVHMLSEASSDFGGTQLGMMGWTRLPSNKLHPLMQALVSHGPIAIAVASGSAWSMYSKGVMKHTNCAANHVIDHAVTLYGYDAESWHIRNSWGNGWGENGNVRLERLADEEGSCDWDPDPQTGTDCKGGPTKVWICGSCGMLYDSVIPHFAAKQ